MNFGAQIVRRKFLRPDALDVPQMKILVAAETEELSIAFTDARFAATGQVSPTARQDGRPAMFEAAVRVLLHVLMLGLSPLALALSLFAAGLRQGATVHLVATRRGDTGL